MNKNALLDIAGIVGAGFGQILRDGINSVSCMEHKSLWGCPIVQTTVAWRNRSSFIGIIRCGNTYEIWHKKFCGPWRQVKGKIAVVKLAKAVNRHAIHLSVFVPMPE